MARPDIPGKTSGRLFALVTLVLMVILNVQAWAAPNVLAANDKSARAYIPNGCSNKVSVVDVASSTVVGDGPYGTVTNPTDGRIFVANSKDRTISVLGHTANGVAVVATLEASSNPWTMAVSPDDSRLVVTNISKGAAAFTLGF